MPPEHNGEPAYSSQRQALRLSGVALAVMTFQTLGSPGFSPQLSQCADRPCSLGIIYSDIGTSPLYVLNGIWPASGPVPPEEDIIGGTLVSLWDLRQD